jgi:hypothetical protein
MLVLRERAFLPSPLQATLAPVLYVADVWLFIRILVEQKIFQNAKFFLIYAATAQTYFLSI